MTESDLASASTLPGSAHRLAPRDVRVRIWRRRFLDLLRKAGRTTLVGVLGLVFLAPFLWMLSTSLKLDPEVHRIPPTWIPQAFRWLNYTEALTYEPFGLYFINTLKYGVFSTLGVVLSSAVCAYSLSRVQWKGRTAAFWIVLSTMMLPWQVRMIPLYLVFKRLGWLDSYLPLVVPCFFGSAYYIFMMRQFFMTIPAELSDAARIDGCNEFGIFSRIILPLSRPALAVVGLFQFMDAWNDYMGPLIYLRDVDKYTLAMGLKHLEDYGRSRSLEQYWPHLMAASAAITIPIVVLYFFTQRTFVEGIALTGVKG